MRCPATRSRNHRIIKAAALRFPFRYRLGDPVLGAGIGESSQAFSAVRGSCGCANPTRVIRTTGTPKLQKPICDMQ